MHVCISQEKEPSSMYDGITLVMDMPAPRGVGFTMMVWVDCDLGSTHFNSADHLTKSIPSGKKR